jgi:hypothetical protein
MKKIRLMVFLSGLVVMLSACADLPLTGTRVELLAIKEPNPSNNWPTNILGAANDIPAKYAFVVSNNGHVPYYGGIWVISIPGYAPRTYRDRQESPILPGQARRVVVASVDRDDTLGRSMWEAIRAYGFEKVSVRISSFDPD